MVFCLLMSGIVDKIILNEIIILKESDPQS